MQITHGPREKPPRESHQQPTGEYTGTISTTPSRTIPSPLSHVHNHSHNHTTQHSTVFCGKTENATSGTHPFPIGPTYTDFTPRPKHPLATAW